MEERVNFVSSITNLSGKHENLLEKMGRNQENPLTEMGGINKKIIIENQLNEYGKQLKGMFEEGKGVKEKLNVGELSCSNNNMAFDERPTYFLSNYSSETFNMDKVAK